MVTTVHITLITVGSNSLIGSRGLPPPALAYIVDVVDRQILQLEGCINV